MQGRILVTVLLGLLGLGVGGEALPDGGGVRAGLGLVAFSKVSLTNLETFHRELTLQLLGQLQEPGFRQLLSSRLLPETSRLSLNVLLDDYVALWPTAAHQAFRDHLLGLDLQFRQAKGLEAFSQGLLGLEVLWPRGGPRVLAWETVLFGVGPQGPKHGVTRVEAYDLQGGLHVLDPHAQPGVLVLMPGADRAEVKRAGIAFLNAGLVRAHFSTEAPRATGPIYCSKLTYIRLADDQEPWWKGAAEVYAFTAGIDPTVDRPNLRLIDLPYLDYDQTDYFPNQLVLFWSDYRFNAADFQLWEQDDGANYQDVLTAVLAAVTTAMTLGGAPVLAWIPGLANAIIAAMPAVWFKDNDDYLDTFYTLERGRTYVHLQGAARNAVIDLEPYTLLPN
jgi:hypothetical protein